MRDFKILQIILFLVISSGSLSKVYAQQTASLSPVYLVAEEMPAFPYGAEGLQKYFNDNLNIKIEDEYKFVTISFIVKADGQVAAVRLVKGFAPKTTPEIDSAVVLVARKMPLWTPGFVDGKAVNTRLLFPIKLQ